jgi:hypothetical protein
VNNATSFSVHPRKGNHRVERLSQGDASGLSTSPRRLTSSNPE